jgi:branched-chain amino acid transport system ATP-binding protein
LETDLAFRSETPFLKVQDLELGYGAAPVLSGLSLEIARGDLAVLLGRNGAGKSTLLQGLAGLLKPSAGTVSFDGQIVPQGRPGDAIELGISMVLEQHRVFSGLTVEDNLLVATYASCDRGSVAKLAYAYDLFPELYQVRKSPASLLSGGQQEILAIAQGLISEPKLLLLDEPSGGLAPLVIERIFSRLSELCKSGLTVLLVEQMAKQALQYADYVFLMDGGIIVSHGDVISMRDNHIIEQSYLGKKITPI